jgi:hypothetical protein
LLLGIAGLLSLPVLAGPPSTSNFIRVDQFGYRTQASKVAVIVDPQQGFDAGESFSPSTATNQYQVRKWDDNAVVFSGTLTAWNNGATDASSGDKAWWFDFSSVTAAGSYYIFDVGNNVGSFKFDINDEVYNNVLKAAVRMFYYNRCNQAKSVANAGANWADGASFVGTNQDTQARSESDRTNAATAKDLSGGWWDAGDYNKYVTFARVPVHQLLDAYSQNPSIWSDAYNIPESGNGVADIVDEVKWELEWLKKMQLSDGSSLLKVGTLKDTDGQASLPPSTDARPRYYYAGSCTSSTIALASMFAHAALVLKTIPSLSSYASDLQTRAVKAYDAYNAVTTKTTDCDNGNIQSGDADWDLALQEKVKLQAAVYLFALTGESGYRSVVDDKYGISELDWWGPYNADISDALLYYSNLSNATASVASAIKAKKVSSANSENFYRWNSTDPYRAYITNDMYHWGSNMIRATVGLLNSDMVYYNLDATNHSQYKLRSEELLHYFHGVNPLNTVYLTNMSSFGAEKSVSEVYHSWFKDGSAWDKPSSSKGGPAPGYVPGGPNASYAPGTGSCVLTPPCNQPRQKAYRDWNGIWPDASWSVTEPAIYYQSAYIKALARLVTTANIQPEPEPPTGIITGLDAPLVAQSPLVVYPNPCDKWITGRMSQQGSEVIQHVTFFNTLGYVVKTVSKQEIEEQGFTTDTKNLLPGIYLMRIVTNRGVTNRQIVKN